MREYLTNYIAALEKLLAEDEAAEQKADYEALLMRHLDMIGFMQHERLVHFLVTMLFALGFFIALGILLVTDQIALLFLLVLILALLIPYIAHYYFLENSVQKLYKLYDEIHKRLLREKGQTLL